MNTISQTGIQGAAVSLINANGNTITVNVYNGLSRDEAELLELYRQLPIRQRVDVVTYLLSLQKAPGTPKPE